MVVNEGVVEQMFVESGLKDNADGDPFEVSDADTMLEYINPKQIKPEPVTVFTKPGCPFCKKAKDLLTEKGYAGKRLAIINGGMDHEEREEIKAAFQTHPEQSDVRILLATDAASEGIDLQNHCNCLIHLEIPYNPNVMEQRNGRIDRHGQKAKEILIWHL